MQPPYFWHSGTLALSRERQRPNVRSTVVACEIKHWHYFKTIVLHLSNLILILFLKFYFIYFNHGICHINSDTTCEWERTIQSWHNCLLVVHKRSQRAHAWLTPQCPTSLRTSTHRRSRICYAAFEFFCCRRLEDDDEKLHKSSTW